jgi:hypothetical protein
MEIIVDIAALLVFLLVVPSVIWAVRAEAGPNVSGALVAFVAIFVTIMGIVFMSAATNLATGQSTTQIIMLAFYVVIAIFARAAWASKSAA